MKRDALTLPLAFPGELIIDNFAGAFRNAARMLAVLESEIRRLHAELIDAQARTKEGRT